ncbi:MAG: DMT family transporter [Crocosphaera sp.]|jgi:drug/metabolite transporter (DMT)-like permease
MFNQLSRLFNRTPGKLYLLLGVIIFAAANAVTRQLINLGEQNLIDGRNPISFCNVLFVGNLCALFLLICVYNNQLSWRTFKQFTIKDWLGLIAVGILSGALAPALIFLALDLTSVNNVVLIGRIEPPLTLMLSVWLLKERVNSWVALGSLISFVGVVVTILLQEPSSLSPESSKIMTMIGEFLGIGIGELSAIFGAISLVFANVFTKVSIKTISLGIFTIIRTFLGTIIFLVIVIQLYGPMHFVDVFSPFLWWWMFIYGAIIVVFGQLCWFMGLKLTKAADVSLANSFSPLIGIFFAYLILKEIPTFPQYVGGSIIIIGIFFNQIGVNKLNRENLVSSTLTEEDIKVGFKGI